MVIDIFSQLEQQGYVNNVAGYEKARKGKGKGKAVGPLFKLVADDKMLTTYIFRPELDIPHKVGIAPTSSFRILLNILINTDLKLLIPSSSSPGSATLSSHGSEYSEPDINVSSVISATKSDQIEEPLSVAQTTLVEASSTEGTPSPRSAVVRRCSERQSQAQNSRVFSLARSHPNRKRPYGSTPEPDLDLSAHHRPRASGIAVNHDTSNSRKLSEVNSPWTFRSSAI